MHILLNSVNNIITVTEVRNRLHFLKVCSLLSRLNLFFMCFRLFTTKFKIIQILLFTTFSQVSMGSSNVSGSGIGLSTPGKIFLGGCGCRKRLFLLQTLAMCLRTSCTVRNIGRDYRHANSHGQICTSLKKFEHPCPKQCQMLLARAFTWKETGSWSPN